MVTKCSGVAWTFRAVELRDDVWGGQDGGRGRDQHVVLASADSRGFVSLRQPATPRPERYAIGRSLRKRVPRSALGSWSVPDSRADPVQQIIATHERRLDRLIPVRIGRMIAFPYAFLRGAAAIMAEDFAHLPSTGITPVVCGDAHLGNFGFYASPERDLVFDLNDFDEAHPGAWEWDLRRLLTSVWVAGRHNGTPEHACEEAVARCVAAYREHMAYLAEQPLLDQSPVDAQPSPAHQFAIWLDWSVIGMSGWARFGADARPVGHRDE
ncbi:MAG: DUF2252 family protein [Pseudonocardiaceae bacterium]